MKVYKRLKEKKKIKKMHLIKEVSDIGIIKKIGDGCLESLHQNVTDLTG